MDAFIHWATENPVAHVESAWRAWLHKEREIALLRVRLMQLQEQNEHLEQRLYEAEQRKLRLVSAA